MNARNGDVIYSYSQVQSDGGHGPIKVYDANQASKEIRDYAGFTGINVGEADPATSTDPEVTAAAQAAHTTLNFWYQRVDLFPYLFMDEVMIGGGDAVHLIVDANVVDKQGNTLCPNSWRVPGSVFGGPDHIVFCKNKVVGDVVAHEMTHGLTAHSSGLIYADESGALNESYSDLFGELVFPDAGGTWIHGDLLPGGPTRNMANPGAPGFGDPDHMSNYLYPGAIAPTPPNTTCVDNYDDLACDWGGVHSNCGIPNLAATYISDGVPDLPPSTGITPGIGRDKLAALSFMTLVNILEEWSGFSDAMLGTVSACSLWREWGWADKFQTPLTQSDCDVIVNAWSRVGIAPSTTMGWYHSSGIFGASEDIVYGPEEYAPRVGCTLRGCLLKLSNLDAPGVRVACTDSSICPPGGTVSDRLDFSNGEFWAKMNCASIGSMRKQANVHVGRSNFEDIAVNVEFIPNIPRGLTAQHCDGNAIQRKSHPIKRHWSNWGVGGKGDEWVGPEAPMPSECRVTGVTLEKLNKDHSRNGSPGREVGTNNSGARIVADPIGTNGLRVKVHWWFNSFNIIRYRVIYTIAHPTDATSCWP